MGKIIAYVQDGAVIQTYARCPELIVDVDIGDNVMQPTRWPSKMVQRMLREDPAALAVHGYYPVVGGNRPATPAFGTVVLKPENEWVFAVNEVAMTYLTVEQPVENILPKLMLAVLGLRKSKAHAGVRYGLEWFATDPTTVASLKVVAEGYRNDDELAPTMPAILPWTTITGDVFLASRDDVLGFDLAVARHYAACTTAAAEHVAALNVLAGAGDRAALVAYDYTLGWPDVYDPEAEVAVIPT